ncbi:SusC/RagA family TonB-linked outer membrane protein [Seonamhaeicola marinus]|uniref:SusC/RagA family TonB-linked outer membrane protein n=1 Tax=Seonamhaeicola marinus TaxID=1912246 RepID=A0A5D0ILD8_9FLAO|nr:SusC/RagA family TonB-linked outer membrane protein [Seonamhaeicola marinus]TYA84306.1 SusC/RagA family TonB-linked outer membrane protein [Seonamhaeicola marinus]
MKYYILLVLTAFVGVVSAQQNLNDSLTKVSVDDKVILPFGEISKDRLVGAVDVITAEDMSHTSDYNVESSLVGLAPGLIVNKGSGSPGFDTTWMRIRGISRGGNDAPLIVIDGIANRALASISIDEVSTIQILKDVTAKMLYGSKAANGVIMVTTKRGYEGKKKVEFFVESGLKRPTVLPEYLNSGQYARLYNQARINDGFDPIYTDEQINNYENSPSTLFPDVDYYDTFLKKSTTFQRINAQLRGGDERTKYFLNVGFIGEDGLEKVGQTQKFNRLNVRSNLDYQVNNTVSAFLDIAGRMDIWDRANITNGEFFNTLSSHRPNDYPIWAGEVGDTDNLGWSPRVGTNLMGELTRSGYVNTKNYYAQTNFGLDFDLDNLVKGLSFGGYVTFDFYNNISIGKNLSYSRIDPSDGTRIGTDVLQSGEVRQGDDSLQNLGLVGTIDFERSWGLNDLQINLSGFRQTLTRKSTLDGPTTQQDDKNMNFGARVNYMFNKKYTIEGSASYMGSDRFTEDNRWGLFGAGGFGWIVSNEDFLKDSQSINFLKLKGSFGVMGYDSSVDYLLYRDFYQGGGGFRFGPGNAVQEFAWRAGQIGNPDLTFEKSREINVGIEARLFNNKLALEANYFNELRTGIPIVLNNAIPDYTGQLKPIGNFNEVSNKGVDVSINYSNGGKDFKYSLGANLIYSKAVNEVFDEINIYSNLNRTGQASDAIIGYVADGLYQDDADIASHGVTSSLGDVIPGDIKLLDIVNDNGDNVINEFDRRVIGNSTPRFNYALNLNLEYKGFELFVIGQGITGFDRYLTNRYYWNTGENKYSVQALGAAVPGAVSGASSPRLTSLTQSHSYRGSSYWLVDGSFFKIRTAELSYAFDEDVSKKLGASNLKLFIRGNDLFTFSKIKDLDPENLNAGVTNYPMYTTVSLGLKLTY